MRQFRFIIILFLLFTNVKAQIIRRDCDTIILNNGAIYRGIVTAMSDRVIKFINCDTLGPYFITVYLKDVQKLNYDRVFNNLGKQQNERALIIAAAKEKKSKQILDTVKCVHFGIIPFQFLTRSSGLYLRYDFKKLSLEYRPSYTYTVVVNPMDVFSHYYDNPFFQGVNNSLIFYFPTQKRTQIGLMLTYKHWWHGIKPIENDKFYDSYKSNDPHLVEMRSTVMDGFGAGLEFAYYFKVHEDYDFNFFWNASFTYFNSYSHVYSIYGPYTNYNGPGVPTYPYTETKGRFYVNATCGFKFGFKKPLKK